MEATPVRAPAVETFKPPVAEINWKVPVVLPMTVAPVLVVARLRIPVPLGAILKARLVVPVVISVPIVPLKVRPLVNVPAVLVMLIPLVVVPAEFWLNEIPLVEVNPVLTPDTTSTTSAAVTALVVPLTVKPTTEATVGETVFWAVVVGTSNRQAAQPLVTQDNTPVDAPPSVDRTVPAAPSAVGRM